MFTTQEWLTTSQIRSYFSRMRLTNTKKMDQNISFNSSNSTTFDSNQYEDEQDSDEEAHAEVSHYFILIIK